MAHILIYLMHLLAKYPFQSDKRLRLKNFRKKWVTNHHPSERYLASNPLPISKTLVLKCSFGFTAVCALNPDSEVRLPTPVIEKLPLKLIAY